MNCPHCGHAQPVGPNRDECAHCGIVFQKFLARHPDAQATNEPGHDAPPAAAEPGLAAGGMVSTTPYQHVTDRPVNVLDQRIGKLAQTIRVAASLTLVGIAVLMYVNGSVFKAFYPYAITLFFGASGLWLLVTIAPRVKIRQFAIEMFILVTISLVLRAFYPEMFMLDSESNARSSANPPTPVAESDEKYGAFVTSINTFRASIRAQLDTDAPIDATSTSELLSGVQYRAIVAAYKSLPTQEREKAFTTFAAARELNEAIRSGLKTVGDGTRAEALETSAKQTINRKLVELESTITQSEEKSEQSGQ